MFAIGNNHLCGRPTYRKGDRIQRQPDGAVFVVNLGTDANTGDESNMLAFIKDGENSYIVGIAGSLLYGWEHYTRDSDNA